MNCLPRDLNKAIKDMEGAVTAALNTESSRFLIEFLFEGLKLNNIAFKLYKLLSQEKDVFILFSDTGSVALAQRDFPDIKEKFYTFKSFNDSEYITSDNTVVISISPQPFDFEFFEPMCEDFRGIHYSINPKFEDANIGIGSVIRNRRKNFVNTWQNLYYIQPLDKGALMHVYPSNWSLFKKENELYIHVDNYEIKPDNETIFVNL